MAPNRVSSADLYVLPSTAESAAPLPREIEEASTVADVPSMTTKEAPTATFRSRRGTMRTQSARTITPETPAETSPIEDVPTGASGAVMAETYTVAASSERDGSD